MRNIFTTGLFFLFIGLPSLLAQNGTTTKDFYDVNTIQDIKISFEQENWQYLLDSLRYNGADFLLGSAEINGKSFSNVGIRWKGSRSFTPGAKRNGLNIKLNYINRSQKMGDHQNIVLSQALRDPSMVREVLAYQIAGKYMPTPEANYARVSINDDFYGLFVNIEDVDENFLNKHFDDSESALFKVNPNAGNERPTSCKNNLFGSLEFEKKVDCYLNNFQNYGSEGWDDLIKLTQILNESPEKIESILNVDRTLWMLALNNVIVNLSSYTGKNSLNYYLYLDKKGRFNPIFADMNWAFGSYKNTGVGSDLKLKNLQELDPLLHFDNPYKPLISQLLKNDLYKKIYLSHLRKIFRDNFHNNSYLETAEQLQALIKTDYLRDPGQRYDEDDFGNSLTKTIGRRSKIPGIKELMNKRSKFLNNNQNVSAVPPSIKKVEVLGRSQFSNLDVEDFKITASVGRFTNRVKLVYRFGASGEFAEANMSDDGKNNDGSPNDGVFGVTIKPSAGKKEIEYFIWAEGPTMISFSPDNYMWEYHKANLEDLNK